jgi:hypothetical protein
MELTSLPVRIDEEKHCLKRMIPAWLYDSEDGSINSSETSVNSYQTIGRRIFKLILFCRITPFNVVDVNVSDELASYIFRV